MDLRESESTLRQYVNACIVYICELYDLVRFSERPLALKCDHLPVGDKAVLGHLLLLLLQGFLSEGRVLSLGLGGTEDRSLETFRTEHFRASSYTLTLSPFGSLLLGFRERCPENRAFFCNAKHSDIEKIKRPLKQSYSFGPQDRERPRNSLVCIQSRHLPPISGFSL